MAISEGPTIESWVAGTTFSSTDVYMFVTADSEGHVVMAADGSTNLLPVGVLYGYTQTTTTESEAVPVATWGVVKVKAAASTLSAGDVIACSSLGMIGALSSDNVACGIIKYGSSGAANRIMSVQLWKFGQKTVNPA